jgi:glycosyltransferase involved in cell wall biosynthesis
VHTLHDHWLLCERTTLVAADGTACDPERRCRGCRAFARAREVELRRHFADVVVAPSQSVAATHVHAWPWLSARMEVVRHPVDASTAAIPAAREPRGPVVFGYLGHLSPAKGVRTLLAAMLGLPAGVARLVVAGRGELEAEVGAADVEWLGWVDAERREQFFATIDCLVVPSQAPETAGLVVDEARARGLAVIAADTGALPEYVDPACRPLLYPPGDVASLTDRLASFVAAPDAYRPTGPMPSSWAEHLDALDAVYERARRVAMRRP